MRAIAAVVGSTKPVFAEVEEPGAPAAGEVLCQTLQLGICGTDREILLSGKPWVPVGEERLLLGHECLARVEAVGDGGSELRAGDLVVPVVRRALGGQTRRVDLLPWGAFVERGIVGEHGFSQPRWIDRPEHLLKVPEEIADLAVLAEPLACSEKAFNEATLITRARLGSEAWSRGEPPRVLVTGMGPIGFTAVLASVARGWPATMLGRDEATSKRAQLVEQFGAQYASLAERIGQDRDIEREGYDLLVECTGNDEVLLAAATLVRSCGVIAWLGSNREPQPKQHNVDRLVRHGLLNNHVHVGCVNAALRDFQDALRDLAVVSRMDRAAVKRLITSRVKPDDALEHFEHRQPQGIKVVVDYC